MKSEIGNTYGTMLVLEHLPSINPTGKKTIRMVKVQCSSCGKLAEKRLDNIKRKGTSGCSRECPGFKATITKHGLTNSRVYKSWDNMVTRCTRTSHKSYDHYDNLIIGEKLDPRWLNFENFLEDMGDPGNKQHKFSIDRIDNKKGYCKDNCKWSTQQEQTLNQEKSIVNKFSSSELQTIKDFHVLASRFKKDGVQLFTTEDIQRIFSMSSSTVTKVLNSFYIDLAKEKEQIHET
jgi:hypothetical protein